MIILSGITEILFATSSLTSHIFGDIGIIALCFLAVMFGSGLLSEVEFNSMSWHTLFLVGGGNVLGKAVGSSGLLEYLADGITQGMCMNVFVYVCVYVCLFYLFYRNIIVLDH